MSLRSSSMGINEQLMPVIRRLITSLEQVSSSGSDWKAEVLLSDHADLSPSPSNVNSQLEAASSMKAPLLRKPSIQEKKIKDHVIPVRDIELEVHLKSTDRGVKIDSTALDSNNPNGGSSSITLQKDGFNEDQTRIHKKWCRHVWTVLTIVAAICLVLLVVWLSICKGISCTR